jgi:Skp family chaperone for outer membrane proteins
MLIGLMILAYFQFFKHDKIGYVDAIRLMSEYKGMKEAQAELQKQTAQWQANVDTLTNELQERLQKYEKNRTGMTG